MTLLPVTPPNWKRGVGSSSNNSKPARYTFTAEYTHNKCEVIQHPNTLTLTLLINIVAVFFFMGTMGA